MSINLSKLFLMKKFAPGAYQKAMQEVCAIIGAKQEEMEATAVMDYGDGLTETKVLNMRDLGVIRSIDSCPRQVSFTFAPGFKDHIFILTYNQNGEICIYVSAPDAVVCDRIHDTFMCELELDEIQPSDGHVMRSTTNPSPTSIPEDSCAATQPKNSETDVGLRGPVYPERITLNWLAKNAPISFWFWLLGILFAIFVLGMKADQISAIKQLFGP